MKQLFGFVGSFESIYKKKFVFFCFKQICLFFRVIGIRRPFAELSLEFLKREKVSDIMLNAAHVSLLLPYTSLREDNVMFLVRVLELCFVGNCRLHFISSVGAMGTNRAERVLPIISSVMNAKNGYGQTKAVCEAIIERVVTKKKKRKNLFFFFTFFGQV
jgi:nucleoside-diphosphate-sugar epimerase